jgi:aspartate/methionine/tyrosine aminotransferase
MTGWRVGWMVVRSRYAADRTVAAKPPISVPTVADQAEAAPEGRAEMAAIKAGYWRTA